LRHRDYRPADGAYHDRRLPRTAGPLGDITWTESYASRMLGMRLAAQPEFWTHVAAVREADDPRQEATAQAARYVRRDRGPRRQIVAHYLMVAASQPSDDAARSKLLHVRATGWRPGGPVEANAPAYAPRTDLEQTLCRAADRVARRGARRCAAPACCDGEGAKLSASSKGDYCSACNSVRRADSSVRDERALFDRVASWLAPVGVGVKERESDAVFWREVEQARQGVGYCGRWKLPPQRPQTPAPAVSAEPLAVR